MSFRWKGEPDRNKLVMQLGPILRIVVPCGVGVHTYTAPDQVLGWQIGDDIGHTCEDDACVTALRLDPRFEEV
jgi:hypothetical protein